MIVSEEEKTDKANVPKAKKHHKTGGPRPGMRNTGQVITPGDLEKEESGLKRKNSASESKPRKRKSPRTRDPYSSQDTQDSLTMEEFSEGGEVDQVKFDFGEVSFHESDKSDEEDPNPTRNCKRLNKYLRYGMTQAM